MNKKTKEKGITLVALVVTIIVLLILAGVAINLVAGGDGIMAKAQSALVTNNIAEAKERVALRIAEYQTDYYRAVYVDKTASVNTEMGDWIALVHQGETIETGDYEFEITGVSAPYKVIILKNNRIKENIEGEMSAIGKTTWIKNAQGGGSGGFDEDEPHVPEVTPDTTAPTVPTTLTLTATDTTITVVASGSTDDVDDEVTYEYSIDNSTWQTSGEFTDLTAETTYSVYARAKDTAGNVSETLENSVKTKYTQIAVNTVVENKNATVTGNSPSTTNPIIPVGFRAVETTDATWSDTDSDGNPDGWNNGLVIEDEDENQFVWVPVDGTTIEYAKNFSYPSYYGATSANTKDDPDALPTDINGNTIIETSQITNYGGFYIGRYEAGVPANQSEIDGTFGNGATSKSDEDGTPVVQKEAAVWTNISYDKAMPNAKRLYSSSTSVRSGIITGTQWDTICAWIDSEKDSSGNSIHSVTNSTNWGNYIDDPVDGDNGKQVTGFKEEWKAKNIYDLAGNVWEWTGEKVTNNEEKVTVGRGGSYDRYGSDYPASYRNDYSSYTSYDYRAFRLVLYVM